MQRYSLPADVYTCIADEMAVFLKLKADQYVGLDGSRTRLFQRLLKGDQDADTEMFARELVEKGLLAVSAQEKASLITCSIDLPSESLIEPTFDEVAPGVRPGHLANLIRACISVRLALRYRSVYYAITKFRKTQEQIRGGGRRVDDDDIRGLVRVFQYLRPLVYPAYDNCLYDSLVLGHFLSRYDVRARCVLAVRTMPFEAHCWLQTNSFVINGTPEMIRRFVPILAV